MIAITAAELADILQGELFGSAEQKITGSCETDSRECTTGSLFFAKPGAEADGHDFLYDALDRGAVCAIVERRVESKITQIVVPSTLAALSKLANWLIAELRKDSELKVIAITGSNGKTTTKNMLREILSSVAPTIAPKESFNNKVGAPISILRATQDTRYLVVEMGAEGRGSIAALAEMADPDVAVILKVGMAHAGEFGGIEATAEIKAELAQALRTDAILVLNADDSRVSSMSKLSKAKAHYFGTAPESEYRGSDIELSNLGTAFVMHWPDQSTDRIAMKILGEHHVFNALAAAAVSDLLLVPHKKIVEALQGMDIAERWRMQRLVREDGVVVINDAYNASPDSMKAALQTLAQLGRMGTRTIAVLGEMAELGEYSKIEHDSIGRLAVRLNIDELVVVGEGAKLIHMGASQEGSWNGESKFFPTIAEALAYLRGILTDGDTVLVKSSKSANLRFLGDDLMEEGK